MDNEKKNVVISMSGVVTSVKSEKTVTVEVERTFQHPVYKKIVRKKKKYLAHDNENKCRLGDVVNMKLVRPLSKNKNWLITGIVSSKPSEDGVEIWFRCKQD